MTPPTKPMTAPRMAARTALILFLFIVVFTAMLSGVYLWTQPLVEASAAEEKMKLIDEILPRDRYDNKLLDDFVTLDAAPKSAISGSSSHEAPTRILRARKDGKIVALVLETIAPDGYAGRIRLLLALDTDERILGVRVIEHKETPGLGDYIEPQKDHNKARPWITQFNDLNPATIDAREWKIKKDGGRFDSVAGATVTPRAVVKAVRKAALFVAANREQIQAQK
jgi:electron transport complex protein RnfG